MYEACFIELIVRSNIGFKESLARSRSSRRSHWPCLICLIYLVCSICLTRSARSLAVLASLGWTLLDLAWLYSVCLALKKSREKYTHIKKTYPQIRIKVPKKTDFRCEVWKITFSMINWNRSYLRGFWIFLGGPKIDQTCDVTKIVTSQI